MSNEFYAHGIEAKPPGGLGHRSLGVPWGMANRRGVRSSWLPSHAPRVFSSTADPSRLKEVRKGSSCMQLVVGHRSMTAALWTQDPGTLQVEDERPRARCLIQRLL